MTRQIPAESGLVRNVALNAMGQGLPLVVAIFLIPVLLDRLGAERFGLLVLAWALVGYFGVFDLGLGRALTKIVADRIGDHTSRVPSSLGWTAVALMTLL